MADETRTWDPAESIETPEDVMLTLEAALEDYEPAHFAKVLGIIARSKGMSEVARKAGVTRDALYKSLTGDGDMRLSTLFGVLKALDIEIRLARPSTKIRRDRSQAEKGQPEKRRPSSRKPVAA